MNTIVALKLIVLTMFTSLIGVSGIQIPAMPDCDKIRHGNDVVCTACNIYHEARSETFRGEIAVANVTRNRVDSDRFPDKFCQVVWQRKQFSWTKDGKSDRVRNPDAWQEAYLIAFITVNGYKQGKSYFEDDTHGSLWYHADYVRPIWSHKIKPAAIIGKHEFYTSIALHK